MSKQQAQQSIKTAHLAAGLDPKDLQYLSINLERERPTTLVRTSTGLLIPID